MVNVGFKLSGNIVVHNLSKEWLIFVRSPEVGYESSVLPFHLIESLIKSLLFSYEHFVHNEFRHRLFSDIRSLNGVKLSKLLSKTYHSPLIDKIGTSYRLFHLLNLILDLIESWNFKSLA
jgi:hypothetical protein